NILVIPDNARTDPTAVVDIPVEGVNLKRDVQITVALTGPASLIGSKNPCDPMAAADDSSAGWQMAYPANGSFVIRLKQPILKQLENNDRITLWLSLDRQSQPFSGSRTFTVLTAKEYRDHYSKNRIPANDIHAFPLPDAEADRLFGPVIAQN